MKTKTYVVTDIEWDIDPEEGEIEPQIEYPLFVKVEVYDDGYEDQVVDILSDNYGYCIINTKMKPIDIRRS
jgi:hypothetical protein